MSDLPRAHHVLKNAAAPEDDHVALDYEGRFLRRKRLVSVAGQPFVVDLAEVTSLDDGDVFALSNGGRIAVRAAPEALLSVTGSGLARLAWHIGNRHTPCRIEPERLLIRQDHVLADMLRRLGADVTPFHAPFQPEGGAYGHGRTLGHGHAPHSHDHPEGDNAAHGTDLGQAPSEGQPGVQSATAGISDAAPGPLSARRAP